MHYANNPIAAMNDTLIPLIIDASYEPNMPECFETDGVLPIFEEEPGSMRYTCMSISYLVDIIFNDVTFHFERPSDLEVVKTYLDWYLTFIGMMPKQNIDAATHLFVDKCTKARALICDLLDLKAHREMVATGKPKPRSISSLMGGRL